MWYSALRPALFALDPETAHGLVLEALRLTGHRRTARHLVPNVACMGLQFANRVGLAAGFDKDAVAVDGLGRLGFGFIEVGTVTPRPQPGQRRPRVFRIAAAGALINRLGFPSIGAAAVAARLRRRRYTGVVGVNIGMNAATPLSRAVDDYVSCFRALRGVADYIAINVSSPNTCGLRLLQTREHLEPLLAALLQERDGTAATGLQHPRLLLKISPDLSAEELSAIALLLKQLRLDGVIATNTTAHGETVGVSASAQRGGLSGPPLRPLALAAVAALRSSLGAGFPIIGVGGVDSGAAAAALRAAGADLVQLYTGLVYRGPALIDECVHAIG